MAKSCYEILAERRGARACGRLECEQRVKLPFTEQELDAVLETYGSQCHGIIEDEVSGFIQELFSDISNGYMDATEFALSIQGAVNRGRG